MEIRILELLDGAKKAEGCTVIIDVFRAFSLEAYFFHQGVETIYPVSSLESAYMMHHQIRDSLLVGERDGKKIEDFDYGNSPSTIIGQDFTGKTIIHTTSAGTQGLANATNATKLLVASLVNSRATAQYIKEMNPEVVSLVCMGWSGVRHTEEDELCALYIKSLLEGTSLEDIKDRALQLRYQEGKKFFDPNNTIFPEDDFWLCIDVDAFPFAMVVSKQDEHLVVHKVNV
ncbi:MAG: 2-phosphosulfolactate phosphatase [Solobacterium sp.]|nr:2-phosphosulfolactate phosphatase [Solobacterium sp.]